MRAVWSFWTKPFERRMGNGWLSDRHHLLSWVLSVETARKHYPETALVTDCEGADLLVNRLGLAFTHVSTALSTLADADPAWWVLGKLWTYRLQAEPFVHIDSDVFLWKRLPAEMEQTAVFAQNPEWFPLSPESWYRPARFTKALNDLGGWMPEEWCWSAQQPSTHAVCCGILGANHVEFIRYYSDLAIRMLHHSVNRRILHDAGANPADAILFEQYLLAACLDYHRHREGSPYADIDIRYLFQSTAESFDEAAAVRAGYTHLIGGAKQNKKLMRSLERRVMRDYPRLYARSRQCVVSMNGV